MHLEKNMLLHVLKEQTTKVKKKYSKSKSNYHSVYSINELAAFNIADSSYFLTFAVLKIKYEVFTIGGCFRRNDFSNHTTSFRSAAVVVLHELLIGGFRQSSGSCSDSNWLHWDIRLLPREETQAQYPLVHRDTQNIQIFRTHRNVTISIFFFRISEQIAAYSSCQGNQ